MDMDSSSDSNISNSPPTTGNNESKSFPTPPRQILQRRSPPSPSMKGTRKIRKMGRPSDTLGIDDKGEISIDSKFTSSMQLSSAGSLYGNKAKVGKNATLESKPSYKSKSPRSSKSSISSSSLIGETISESSKSFVFHDETLYSTSLKMVNPNDANSSVLNGLEELSTPPSAKSISNQFTTPKSMSSEFVTSNSMSSEFVSPKSGILMSKFAGDVSPIGTKSNKGLPNKTPDSQHSAGAQLSSGLSSLSSAGLDADNQLDVFRSNSLATANDEDDEVKINSSSAAIGPMKGKYWKHKGVFSSATGTGTSTGLASGSGTGIGIGIGLKERTASGRNPKRKTIFNKLLKFMQLDSGFSTVYSTDPKDQKAPELAKKSSSFVDLEPESRQSLKLETVPGPTPDPSPFVPENDRQRLQELDASLERQETQSSLEVVLKDMGIANRQEGGMDMESALLVLLMDPTHPHSKLFQSTSKVDNIYDFALRANETELDRLITELSDDHPEVIALKAATADMYKGLDMPLAAEVLLKQVIDSQRRVLGLDHPDLVSSMNDLGLLLLSTQRYAEAQSAFEEVVSAVSMTQGEGHPDVAAALGNLAVVLRSMGDFASAIKMHERLLLVLEKAKDIGPGHEITIYQRGQLGVTYYQMGALNKGLSLMTRARDDLQLGCEKTEIHPWILALDSYISSH